MKEARISVYNQKAECGTGPACQFTFSAQIWCGVFEPEQFFRKMCAFTIRWGFHLAHLTSSSIKWQW